MTWRTAHASCIGTSHVNNNVVCQDASSLRLVEASSGTALVCAVSDGAGSAPNSAEGAALACKRILDCAEHWWRAGPQALPSREQVTDWVFDATSEITALAEAQCAVPRDFACTLLGAVLCPLGAIYVQVGDGAIVAEREGLYAPVFWPDNGEAMNLTCFITDETWWEHMQWRTEADVPSAIALFSDGLQLLVLDFATRSAHAPFFRQVFEQLRACPKEQLPNLNAALSAYLDSDGVNSRTDDDKTLVLAAAL
jgi:hypothetical protein